ncbi:hypothetical protein C8R44DRAFT_884968 [Mycena epipterygia]|nr:hypothetical protein C8R44DRAFT_884968 [Mycena epipterygia]
MGGCPGIPHRLYVALHYHTSYFVAHRDPSIRHVLDISAANCWRSPSARWTLVQAQRLPFTLARRAGAGGLICEPGGIRGTSGGHYGDAVGVAFAFLVKKEDIGWSVSPEDYTSLWGWVSFRWVHPLLQRGRNTTLNEKDVWDMSPNIRSRPIFIKFSTLPQKTLLTKLWAENSFDIIRILDAVDASNETEKDKTKAYIYALLMFVCPICKSQCDIQHLWIGRRAATRMRSELMAAIYDKALKRKDFSGVVDKDKGDFPMSQVKPMRFETINRLKRLNPLVKRLATV